MQFEFPIDMGATPKAQSKTGGTSRAGPEQLFDRLMQVEMDAEVDVTIIDQVEISAEEESVAWFEVDVGKAATQPDWAVVEGMPKIVSSNQASQGETETSMVDGEPLVEGLTKHWPVNEVTEQVSQKPEALPRAETAWASLNKGLESPERGELAGSAPAEPEPITVMTGDDSMHASEKAVADVAPQRLVSEQGISIEKRPYSAIRSGTQPEEILSQVPIPDSRETSPMSGTVEKIRGDNAVVDDVSAPRSVASVAETPQTASLANQARNASSLAPDTSEPSFANREAVVMGRETLGAQSPNQPRMDGPQLGQPQTNGGMPDPFQVDPDIAVTERDRVSSDLPADDLAPIAEARNSKEATATDTSRAVQMNRAEPVRQVTQGLVELVQKGADDTIEVSLNPEELGRVRISLSQSDSGLMVTLNADRGETLELLRRHIADLQSDLARLGYGQASFDFSGGGQEHAAGDSPVPKNDGDVAALPELTTIDAEQLLVATGLDLRL